MKRVGNIAAFITATLALVPLLYWIALFVLSGFDSDFLAIDRCLDAGGRWDYAAGKCER